MEKTGLHILEVVLEDHLDQQQYNQHHPPPGSLLCCEPRGHLAERGALPRAAGVTQGIWLGITQGVSCSQGIPKAKVLPEVFLKAKVLLSVSPKVFPKVKVLPEVF